MNKFELVLVAILVVALVLVVAFGCQKISEEEALSIKVRDGALRDLGYNKNDYDVVEIYLLKSSDNAFILQLDEQLYIGSYKVNDEGNLYVDAIGLLDLN